MQKDSEGPRISGKFADHPRAKEFAAEVAALARRYAVEVVHAYRLCPFLNQVDAGLGAVCVVLDDELNEDFAKAEIRRAASPVVHAVFPLVDPNTASKFERFGNGISDKLRKDGGDSLVHASFHPSMIGGRENPHRMVGLLRRAPDPFLQFIPPGIQGGGTVVAGLDPPKEVAVGETYQRLMKAGALDSIQALLAGLQVDRERAYAPFRASGLPIPVFGA